MLSLIKDTQTAYLLRNLQKTDLHLELSCKVTLCITKLQKKHKSTTRRQSQAFQKYFPPFPPYFNSRFFSAFLGGKFPHLPLCMCPRQNSWSSRWLAALHRRLTNTCTWESPQRDLPYGTTSLEFLLPSPTPLLRDGAGSLKPLSACFLHLLSL